MTKCGFIVVIGAPNVGKSTLVNALVGSKVTIVSPKVQTTRSRILGIAFEKTDLILNHLEKKKKNVVIVLNKIDLIPRNRLLSIAQHFSRPNVEYTFMISALKRDGIYDIKKYWANHVPEGPWLFPKDQLSDLPQKLLAAEITREELFHRLHQELPYSIWVETDQWEEFKNGSVKIIQSIYVQRESQRVIVLGKGGSLVKAIGEG